MPLVFPSCLRRCKGKCVHVSIPQLSSGDADREAAVYVHLGRRRRYNRHSSHFQLHFPRSGDSYHGP